MGDSAKSDGLNSTSGTAGETKGLREANLSSCPPTLICSKARVPTHSHTPINKWN